MRARYYSPYLCRFVSEDPAGFSGGMNFYAYADGNPVSFLDPFGFGAMEPTSGFWQRTIVATLGAFEEADYGTMLQERARQNAPKPLIVFRPDGSIDEFRSQGVPLGLQSSPAGDVLLGSVGMAGMTRGALRSGAANSEMAARFKYANHRLAARNNFLI